jgi:hypothetical protein
MNFIGYEPDRQERLSTIMKISETEVSPDRITALENKVRDMDAQVRVLLAELLDLRAITGTMSRLDGERGLQEPGPGQVVQITASPAMAAPASSMAEPAMVRIMQTDGTMKMEARYGESGMINSAAGYGKNRKGSAAATPQSPLIYAAEEEKSGPAKE